MKKRALILLTLLATIAIGITAQQVGRQMIVNYGGKIIATYNLPQNIDSLTFRTYNFYTVTANSADASMGKATSSSNAVEDGTLVTLTATPNEGYEFSNWTVNGEVVSTANPYTATVTENTEFVANFEEGELELEYCTISGISTHSKRYLPSFTLTDGVIDLEVTDIQSSTKRPLYHDKTSVVLETTAGATIRFKELPWVGEWMHGYVFIDYNKDGVFNNTLNSNGQTGGELVSYNFYSATDASTGQNSKGETVNNNCGVTASNMPEWTLPSYLPSGKYRMRFNIAWDSINPCGYASMGADGGAMVDITIRVVNLPARTISVSANNDIMGSAYVGEEGTTTLDGQIVNVKIVAVANEGYEFVNWTLNGEVISTSAKFVDRTKGDKAYVANFEAIPIYEVSVSSANKLLGTVTPTQGEVAFAYKGDIITLTATPTSNAYRFVNWTVNGKEVSTENPYTATITANTEFVANFEPNPYNGHEYVDLGLPSGLKWATCNVGANSPEEYGNCFAWGETEPKDNYDWSTYKYCNDSSSTMTKYCKSSSYGIVDNKTVLELEDDAAHVNWGGDWRMPTEEEYEELRDTNNCTWTWITQNGVKGYRVTSKVNDNYIFIPADPGHGDNWYTGYWSSSLNTTISCNAYRLNFSKSIVDWSDAGGRYLELPVRPVCD